MKTLKKSMGIILAMVMTVLFTTSAFAVEVDVTGRKYEAYQIFKGTQNDAVDGEDAPLCDIEWGNGVDSVKLLEAIKSIESAKFATCLTATDVAKELDTLRQNGNTAAVEEFAKLADIYRITANAIDLGTYSKILNGEAVESNDTVDLPLEDKLTPGYYLIVDNSETADKDTAKNLSLLQMTKNGKFVINSKTDIPMVEKKVWEDSYDKAETALTTGYPLEKGYNDVADHNIGDEVPFMLIGTMPSKLKDYDTYKYIFHDTLSKGLTYDYVNAEGEKNVAKVYVDNGAGLVELTKDFTIASETDKTSGETKLTITFEDVKKVPELSVDSKIIVKYTARLNEEAEIGLNGNPNEVYLEYSNNPNSEGDGDTDESDDTGESKVDKVIVFTYQLDVSKVDEDMENLAGAVFKLTNSDGLYYAVNDADKTIYWTDDENAAYEFVSTTDDYFSAIGLDEGTYTLIETKAPKGYSAIDPISITIDATTYNGQEWTVFDPTVALTGLTITVIDHKSAEALDEGKGDVDAGSVKLQVVNNPGSMLPETGGMGTVVIYTIGAILAVGSIVLLVAKKRMNK